MPPVEISYPGVEKKAENGLQLNFVSNKTFTPRDRLIKNKDFDKVFKFGTHMSGNNLTIIRLPAHSRRIGFIISHQIKGAVVRNKLKRRLRELYRQNKEYFKGDYIILVHKGAEQLSYSELKEETLKLVLSGKQIQGVDECVR
ncbi:MAG: ribonuclease P protein component [bacterium]|nr:ribonuclease P protein component [bacterium]